MLVEDFLFFFSHYAFHHPAVYRYIHKVHHEYRFGVSILAEYDDYREIALYFVLNLLVGGPTFLGGKLHMVTSFMLLMIRTAHNIDHHTGYDFSWNPMKVIPMICSADYHQFHHTD